MGLWTGAHPALSTWHVSDGGQQPQGQRRLINFTAQADGCVFESWAPERLRGEAPAAELRPPPLTLLNSDQASSRSSFSLKSISFCPWVGSGQQRGVFRATVRALACFQSLSWKEELMPLEWEYSADTGQQEALNMEADVKHWPGGNTLTRASGHSSR